MNGATLSRDESMVDMDGIDPWGVDASLKYCFSN